MGGAACRHEISLICEGLLLTLFFSDYSIDSRARDDHMEHNNYSIDTIPHGIESSMTVGGKMIITQSSQDYVVW